MATRARRYGNGETPFRGPRTLPGTLRWDEAANSYARGPDVTIPDCTYYNSEMKAAMGCDPKRHWPDEGVEPRWVCDVLVQVLPKAATKGQGRRCVARCNVCERWVCAGHMGQHWAACKAEIGPAPKQPTYVDDAEARIYC